MKAELSLPDRPSALYLVAVLDVLAGLLIFFTFIPVVAQQAGTVVEPAQTSFRLPTMEGRITLTARAGPQLVMSLGMKKVRLEELPQALAEAKASAAIQEVVFIPDRNLRWEVVVRIREAILAADLRVAEAGRFPIEESAPEN